MCIVFSYNRKTILLWYGVNKKTSPNFIRQKKLKLNQNTQLQNFTEPHTFRLTKNTYWLYIPHIWRFLLVQNRKTYTTQIVLISSLYTFYAPLPSNVGTYYFLSNASTLFLQSLYTANYTQPYLKTLQNVITIFVKPFFRKLKFTGKGYYIYKNKRNTVAPQFGYSHRLYLYSYLSTINFFYKSNILVSGLNPNDITRITCGIKALRPLNIFTLKGVRFAKQIIYKKKGKISSYR